MKKVNKKTLVLYLLTTGAFLVNSCLRFSEGHTLEAVLWLVGSGLWATSTFMVYKKLNKNV